MANTTTLRRVLTQSKPELLCKMKPSRNSTNFKWPNIDAETMTPWDDFNIETLNESYGHILDLEIPTEKLAGAPRAEDFLQGLDMTKPAHMMHLTGWNDRLLRPTLAFAKQHLGLYTGVNLQHHVATPTNDSFVRISNVTQPLKMEHLVALDEVFQPNLVIGLTRPSLNFQGRRMINCPQTVSREGFWPLRQLANLCDKAVTRYGYVVTDQDLVVCCFFKPEPKPEPREDQAAEAAEDKRWKVALMPVPWTRHGEAQLTTDIALWWLSMLALSSTQHRAPVTKAEMVGIGEWEILHLDDERGWVRRHRYSNVEQPADPPSPPAYQTPSPGNPAAFAAGVGLNMDAGFDINPDYVFNVNDHNLLFSNFNNDINYNNDNNFNNGDNNFNDDNNFNNDINFNNHNFNNIGNFNNGDNNFNNNIGFNNQDAARD